MMASPAAAIRLRKWCRWQVHVLPAGLFLAVTLPHLGQGDFRGDAGWYSAIGVQAWRTGKLWTLWGEPGLPYFNKPPMAFWIHGLVLHAAGVNVAAARAPSVVAGLMCVLLTAAIGRELCGRRAAMLSGCVLALSLEFFRRVREISLDMWQLAFLLAALWMVVAAVRRGRGWMIAAAGVPLGLALMTKPLMGFLLIPLAAGWLVWIGQARWAWKLIGTALVASLLAAPWHISMIALHGREFLAQYFGAEIAERAAGRLGPASGGDKPWWFYLAQIGSRHWPWLLCVALGVVQWARGGFAARFGWMLKLSAIWTLGWLILLTLYADRRDRYSLPVYPGMAWMAGVWLAVAWPRLPRVKRFVWRGLGPVAVIGAIVFALVPVRLQDRTDPQWPALFAWVREQGIDRNESARPWAGGIAGAQAARLYLEFGWWPRTSRNRWGDQLASPPSGSTLIYHSTMGWTPGEGETELFRSGDVTVSRLDGAEWKPVRPGAK